MNIVVIGAGRGLGAVLVQELRKRGHTVEAGYHRLPETADNSLSEYLMDVMDEKSLIDAADAIRQSAGKVDAVVDVAGILLDSDRTCTLMDEPEEDLMRQLDVNAIGIVRAFRAFYPVLSGGGRFLAVTSEGGSFSLAGSLFPGYSVSKTAANKYVQVLRETIRKEDVDIFAIHPGRMNTGMGRTTAQIEPEEAAAGISDILEGKIPVDTDRHWFIDYLGRPMPL